MVVVKYKKGLAMNTKRIQTLTLWGVNIALLTIWIVGLLK